jgi:hypothetical protein
MDQPIAVFRAGFRAVSGKGECKLLVYPGQLRVEPRSMTARVTKFVSVTQNGTTVRVLLARLSPLFGVTVVLTEDSRSVIAELPRWKWRQVRAALEAAGIEPELRTRWFASGLSEIKGPMP